MNGLLGMGLVGWIVSLVIGFMVGGVFFLSMKVQVDYVVSGRGPMWQAPACMYARMVFLAAVLIAVALVMKDKHPEKIPAAMLAGITGVFTARVLIGRMVGRGKDEGGADGVAD
ncbi:MAG: hypothetical protein QGH74_04800 [Candidatus Brocadiia bacterium]|jgi:uncharacterized membrane protein YhdT|nr:hypothetical protein [Candidatus Brocadiia bacterium]